MAQLNINRITFERAIKTCDRLLCEFDSPQPDRQVIEALARHTIVEYTKNFNSDNSVTFDAKIFPDNLPQDVYVYQISLREFHYFIMKYRSKHIAHSDIYVDTGWARDASGEIEIVPFIGWDDFYDNPLFYRQLQALCIRGLDESIQRIHGVSKELMKLKETGQAKFIDEDIPPRKSNKGIPIRELWKLPTRNSK